MPDQDKSTLDQLIDLFVYAPVGMIYEYPDVLPQLIKRGKSQVQLAKVLSQMAAKQGQKGVDSVAGDLWNSVAQGITEVGTMVGLAPEPVPPASVSADEPKTAAEPTTASPAIPKPAVKKAASKKAASKKAASEKAVSEKASPTKRVAKKKAVAAKKLGASTPTRDGDVAAPPIARYDELTARQLIDLVASLDEGQRQRVRVYEQANRNRKTLLAKLDALDAA